MQNVIYTKTVKPASDSPAGDEPMMVRLAEEANGFVVWFVYDAVFPRPVPLATFSDYNRHVAIEKAVDLGREKPEALEERARIINRMLSV